MQRDRLVGRMFWGMSLLSIGLWGLRILWGKEFLFILIQNGSKCKNWGTVRPPRPPPQGYAVAEVFTTIWGKSLLLIGLRDVQIL